MGMYKYVNGKKAITEMK